MSQWVNAFFMTPSQPKGAVKDLEWRVLNFKHIQHCMQRSFYQTIKWASFQYLGVSAPPNSIVLTGSFHQTLTHVASRLFQEQSRKVQRSTDLSTRHFTTTILYTISFCYSQNLIRKCHLSLLNSEIINPKSITWPML